ncbi:hypothetical protein [Aedoeadaptatus urinae]|uniref:hypothetical protein n=1 Tax=Aedoeadaptatus urinae TaxID=1871017 RepID=UPI001F3D5214|nr:hypothetical protein [Peptoniphilus urinae]
MEFEDIQNRLTARLPEQLENQKISDLLRKSIQPYKELMSYYRCAMMEVEVQLRTISMDWWASLEHKIRYKKGLPHSEYIERELNECAEMSAALDERMERLYIMASERMEDEVAE